MKTREVVDAVHPEENLNREKQRRIIRAAREFFSGRNDPEMHYRFDIVAVVLPKRRVGEVSLFRDAFREN